MPGQIKALERHKGVVAVGYVEDLAQYFDHCKMTVVPLRFGAGIKGKIGTSASFGVPSVATTISIEGMGFVDGEHILVADDPGRFAELVVKSIPRREIVDQGLASLVWPRSMNNIHSKRARSGSKNCLAP